MKKNSIILCILALLVSLSAQAAQEERNAYTTALNSAIDAGEQLLIITTD